MSCRNITSERSRLGKSQKDLARDIGVSEKTIGIWENNPKKAPGSALLKMADLFHCSTDYLLGLTNERTHSKSA